MTAPEPLALDKVLPSGNFGVLHGYKIHASVHGKETTLTAYTAAGEQIPPVLSDYITKPDGQVMKTIRTRTLDRIFHRDNTIWALGCQWTVTSTTDDGLAHCALLSASPATFEVLAQQGRVHDGWDRYDQRGELNINEIDATTIVETDINQRTGKRDPQTARPVYSWPPTPHQTAPAA